jgi:hypothetical protein
MLRIMRDPTVEHSRRQATAKRLRELKEIAAAAAITSRLLWSRPCFLGHTAYRAYLDVYSIVLRRLF